MPCLLLIIQNANSWSTCIELSGSAQLTLPQARHEQRRRACSRRASGFDRIVEENKAGDYWRQRNRQFSGSQRRWHADLVMPIFLALSLPPYLRPSTVWNKYAAQSQIKFHFIVSHALTKSTLFSPYPRQNLFHLVHP